MREIGVGGGRHGLEDEKVVLTWALGHCSKGRASDRDFMLAVVQSNGEVTT